MRLMAILANFMLLPGLGTCLIGKPALGVVQGALFLSGVIVAVFFHAIGIVAAFMAWTWSIDTARDYRDLR